MRDLHHSSSTADASTSFMLGNRAPFVSAMVMFECFYRRVESGSVRKKGSLS